MSQIRKFTLCFGLLLALLGAGPVPAQVFWSIETSEGRHNWLLGTLHSEDRRLMKFPPVLRQALATADTVALELFPDEDIRSRLQQAMQLPEGETLADHLERELYLRTLEALAESGVPRRQALRLRPWAAAMSLSQPP
ncbi:MAG: TraB/GumN family protein, partial [Wenzhouxiangellaceae bacterium]